MGASVTFHDVDFVLEGVALPGVHVTTGTKRPDYIARVEEPGRRVLYYAVECKGRRSHNPKYMAVQLATGARQVQHLRVGGLGLPSLIVGTSAGPGGIHVYVLDPEDEGLSHAALDRVEPKAKPILRETAYGEELDTDEFVERITAAASAEILLNAGLYAEAGELLLEGLDVGDSSFAMTLGGQPFVGELFSVPIDGRDVTCFRGVLATAVDRARARDGAAPTIPANDVPRPLELGEEEDLGEEIESLADEDLIAEDPGLEGVTSVDDSGFTVGMWHGRDAEA